MAITSSSTLTTVYFMREREMERRSRGGKQGAGASEKKREERESARERQREKPLFRSHIQKITLENVSIDT